MSTGATARVTRAAASALTYDVVAAPIGQLIVASDGSAIVGVWMANASPSDDRWERQRGSDGVLAEARRELLAYFDGTLREFRVPLAPNGTEFQRRVWTALTHLSYGTTISYGDLARRLGNLTAVRAVGAANGRNPIPIIVPCHRVIGSDGSLTGFGGGLDRKRWLLHHEGALAGGQEDLGV